MSEHDEQVEVVKWFKLQHKKHNIFSIPNGSIINSGGNGGKKGMGRLQWSISEGFRSGVSDLFIAVPVAPYAGLWLEMKDVGKKEKSLSKNQVKFLEDMREAGYKAEWAAGFDEAKEKINSYLKALLELP